MREFEMVRTDEDRFKTQSLHAQYESVAGHNLDSLGSDNAGWGKNGYG